MLLTLKRAEDDKGFIIRLNETEGLDKEVEVTISIIPKMNIEKVYETNFFEVNERILEVHGQTIRIPMEAFTINTI